MRQQDALDEARFLQELPHALRNDMLLGMAAHLLPQLPGFAALGPLALRALASRLQPLLLPPGHILCEPGDPVACVWILQEGEPAGEARLHVGWAYCHVYFGAAGRTLGLKVPLLPTACPLQARCI